MVALIGWADYFAGPQYSLLLFYLVPILHASWFAGRRAGILVSFISSLAWLASHELASPILLNPYRAVWNVFIRLGIFLLITHLISWQQSLVASLESEKLRASTDPLTGVLNRRGFGRLISREQKRASRYKRPFSIAFIDLDDFKKVNDQFGHAAGDRLLCIFADTVRKSLRSFDQIGRLGGDEFAILFPETEGDTALEVVNRIRARSAETLQQQGFHVTASIGLATYAPPHQENRDRLKQADELMYEAKRQGKDQIQHKTYG
jgi:diguanylate cyclase (GGDEF)-like protein